MRLDLRNEVMMKLNKKKGSIGITMVMLVFCLLMSVSMAYHKTIQTESLIQNNADYSDRAVDAAFSGINYAMAEIQSYKKVFSTGHVYFVNSSITMGTDDTNKGSNWISLSSSATFEKYYDEDRVVPESPNENEKIPPYRFKVACNTDSYFENDGKKCILIKSYGDYFKYEGNTSVATYSAQIMAECIIETDTRTIKLKRYRKMKPQIYFVNGSEYVVEDFYSFTKSDFLKDKGD